MDEFVDRAAADSSYVHAESGAVETDIGHELQRRLDSLLLRLEALVPYRPLARQVLNRYQLQLIYEQAEFLAANVHLFGTDLRVSVEVDVDDERRIVEWWRPQVPRVVRVTAIRALQRRLAEASSRAPEQHQRLGRPSD